MPENEEKFLKREEIRTMAKDIARLREMEAKKERERIAEMKAKREEAKKIIPTYPPEIGSPPKRLPSFEKFFIRAGFAIIFILILAILIWQFGIKKPPPTVLPPEIPEIPPMEVVTPQEEIIRPELVIPPALISVEAEETLEISALEEVPQSLSSILKKDLGEDRFTRILIKDIRENKILGLKEFLQAFEVRAPENLYNKLENDFTLFIYSSKGSNRLGFLTKIVEKENLTNLMKSWEKTMEEDLEKLLLTLGKEGRASPPYFKSAYYKGITFRYLSIPPANFGICWARAKDFFIFTTSGQSLIKTIDKIK